MGVVGLLSHVSVQRRSDVGGAGRWHPLVAEEAKWPCDNSSNQEWDRAAAACSLPINRTVQPAVLRTPFEVNVSHLAPRTRHLLLTGAAEDVHDVVVDAHGANVTALTTDGRRVALHEADDPVASSRDMVARVTAQGTPSVLIVIGIGLGYLLDALEQTGLTTKVIALEPLPGVARAMLARRDWTGWLASGRLTLLVGPDYAGATDAWRVFDRPDDRPAVIMAPVIGREFPEAAARAKDTVRQVLAGVKANDDARRRFAGRYLLNTLANLPVIASEGDAGSLNGCFRQIPAIVVAAGPSLDQNLAMLARLESRALIIAVDTALRPLLAAGIHPHLVVSVDPSKTNARHLEGLANTRGVWLVAEASVEPDVVGLFARRAFTFRVGRHEPWPWLTEHGIDRGLLRAWGSVLTTAFDLARVAGCDPIVFAGADLAYTGGVPYCRNTVYEPEWRHLKTAADREREFHAWLRQRDHAMEADVHGGRVLTAPRFLQFRDWLVSESQAAGAPRCINATGGGILHGGQIVQTDLASLRLPDLGTPPRHAVAAAWHRTAGDHARDRGQLLHQLLGHRSAVPTEAWLAFGGDTATADAIDGALDDATVGLRRLADKARYLKRRREFYNDRCHSEIQARRVVHAHYAWARAQAPAQLRQMLGDLTDRTLTIKPDVGLPQLLATPRPVPATLRLLDFGCGLGRMMEPLVAAGFAVDGVDVSDRMLARVRRNRRLADCQLFRSQGNDCGAAPDRAYDLIYSQLCFQHITPRSVRNEILDAWARVLKPGGMIFVQLPFFPHQRVDTITPPNLPWSADGFDIGEELDDAQVWPTPDELALIHDDFSRHFSDLRLQVVDFPSNTHLVTTTREAWFSHLIVTGTAGCGLAERIYSPFEPPVPAAR